jgi:hypothetical protein
METLVAANTVELINENSFDKKALVATFDSSSNLCYFITEKFAISFYDSRCYCNLFCKQILGVETAVNKPCGYYSTFTINKIVGDIDNELKDYLLSAENMTINTSLLHYLESRFPKKSIIRFETSNKRLMKTMNFKNAVLKIGLKYFTTDPTEYPTNDPNIKITRIVYLGVKKETEKAILFSTGGDTPDFWCPKSLIKNGELPYWIYCKAYNN